MTEFLSKPIIYKEELFLQEILLNLFGYNSQFFQKIHPEDLHHQQLLYELSQTSKRFLDYTNQLTKYSPFLPTNEKNSYYQEILPKIFYQTFPANHLLLTTIPSRTLIQKLLQYFHELMSTVYLLRVWCQSKIVILPTMEADGQRNGPFLSKFSPPLTNEEEQKMLLLEGDGYGGEEIFVIKTSIQEVLLAFEQEFHLIELQVKHHSSLIEQVHSLPGGIAGGGGGVGIGKKMTVLTFYQRCKRYDDLFSSLLGMVLNFHDNYDVFVSNPTRSSDPSLHPSSLNYSSHEQNFLQRYFNQISFLYQSEIVLNKGEKLECYSSFGLSDYSKPSKIKQGHHPIRSPSSNGSSSIFMTKDGDSFDSMQYFYLYMKQLFVRYVSVFTQQIMKAIWLNAKKVTITQNLPLLLTTLTTQSSNQGILAELTKYESNYDISILLELLPSSSYFYELFQQIEYSIEDCEIIHKITLPSVNEGRGSLMKLFKKKSQKQKKKLQRTNEGESMIALTRNEFLEFIDNQSTSFSQKLQFPPAHDRWYSYLHEAEQITGKQRSSLPAMSRREVITHLYSSSIVQYYLKYKKIQDVNYLFYYLIGDINVSNLHYDGIIPFLLKYEHQQVQLGQLDGSISQYLSIHQNGLVGIREGDPSAEEKELRQADKFLITSHQLHQLFTHDHLNNLHKALASTTETRLTVAKSSDKTAVNSSSSLLEYQFIPYKHLYQKHFLSPFQSHLLTIQQYSYQLIDQYYSFSKHLAFLQQLFLFHNSFHYDSLRELCHFYVYFPTSPSLTNAESLASLTAIPLYSSNKKVEGATLGEGGGKVGEFPFISMRKSLELLTIQEFSAHEFHLLNNLQSSISMMIEDTLPKYGIQSYYFHFPIMSEFFRSSSSSSSSTTKKQSSSSLLSSFSSSSSSSFEHVFVTMLQEMKYEIFYQWPMSMIFPQVILQQLQQIHSYLLLLQILKWFSEFYWKSVISNNSLQIQYRQFQQVRQERKVANKPTATTQPARTASLKQNRQSPGKLMGRKSPNKESEVIAEGEGEEEEEEEEEEYEMKVRKEIVHIYDEEYDILLAKKQIQYQLLLYMTMIKCIHDYTLVYIHEYLWKECIASLLVPQSPTSSASSRTSNPMKTVAKIRYSIEEMIQHILQFILIFQKTIEQLWKEIFQAFNELRHCLVLETQYLYQVQAEEVQRLQRKAGIGRSTPPKITKNQRLIAFRITEKAFLKMASCLKQLYQIIEKMVKSKRYYSPSQREVGSRAGSNESEGYFQERKNKLKLYEMKLFEEMQQRLQGQFSNI